MSKYNNTTIDLNIVAQRMKEARAINGQTQKEIAEKTHLAPSTIMRYEKGEIRSAKVPVLESIASALNVTPSWLIGRDVEMRPAEISDMLRLTIEQIDATELKKIFDRKNHKLPSDIYEENLQPHSNAISIPILNTVVAGLPLSAYEEVIGYEEVSRKLGSPDELFALKVKGDSMLPVLQEGDIIIVKQQSDVESGDIAIVLINGDEATVKKVMKSQDGITLIAFNPAVYEPHFYPNDEIVRMPIRIAGKVVEMKRSF